MALTVASTTSSMPSTASSMPSTASSMPSTASSMPAGGRRARPQLSHLPQRPPVDLAFQDLTYTVSTGSSSQLILRGLCGEFRSGELTAIMGPSGAGKSTLLNILAGYRTAGAGGSVSTNGSSRALRSFRKLSRYIMQQDVLQPYLTVHESMLLAADLKLGSQLDAVKKRVVVEEIIELLLLEKARDTLSQRLSGGERKRLSVALELLNNPPVLFLDEPTTGLDEVASRTCVELLARVARGGRTVVVSLHTPSASLFAQLHHVYLVAGGRCAYSGAAAGVLPFLSSLGLPCPTTYNPADFLVEVCSGEYGAHTERMVAASENGRCERWRGPRGELSHPAGEPARPAGEPSHPAGDAIETLNAGGHLREHEYARGSTPAEQFLVLLRRMLLQTLRNKSYLRLRVGMHVFLGLIVGLLFQSMGDDASKTLFNFGFCYACTIAMLYVPMMPVLLAFPAEVALVKREYFNRWYGLGAYYCALVAARTPATVLFSCIYLCITYPLTAQPLEPARVAMFAAVCVLVALTAEAMGTVIASSLSVVNSVFLGPALSVPLMLLAVYGLGQGETPPPLLWRAARACSFLRYGIQGLVSAVYGPPRADLRCPPSEDYCEYKNVAYFVKLMGMSGTSFWGDVGALAAMLLAAHLAAYYLLRQRLRPNMAFRAIRLLGHFVKNKMSSVH